MLPYITNLLQFEYTIAGFELKQMVLVVIYVLEIGAALYWRGILQQQTSPGSAVLIIMLFCGCTD